MKKLAIAIVLSLFSLPGFAGTVSLESEVNHSGEVTFCVAHIDGKTFSVVKDYVSRDSKCLRTVCQLSGRDSVWFRWTEVNASAFADDGGTFSCSHSALISKGGNSAP
jgi:hypothetical protein